MQQCDVLVAVEGDKHTADIIELALALEKPCLPLPFSGGAAAEKWQANRNLLVEWLSISQQDIEVLEGAVISQCSAKDLERLVDVTLRLIKTKLKPRCLVIMPFKGRLSRLYREVFKPGIEKAGCMPVRMDEIESAGNAIMELRSAMRSCECAVALVTDRNPNVMYELGFMHALGKPVVLVCRNGGEIESLPFDVRTERVLEYDPNSLDELRRRLTRRLKHLVK